MCKCFMIITKGYISAQKCILSICVMYEDDVLMIYRKTIWPWTEIVTKNIFQDYNAEQLKIQ